MVYELAAVVGMKTPDAEGELVQHRVENRQQVCLADLRRRSQHLPLRHLVNGVEVIDPFDPIPVTLMHRIDTQVSRPSVRLRPAPLANVYRRGPCWLINHAALPVPRTPTQSVQLGH